MKRFLLIIVLLGIFGFIGANAFGAEYIVKGGDTIGIIAQKTGQSVENIALLNNIEAPKYVVRIGQRIEYISEEDRSLARTWIYDYVMSRPHIGEDYFFFQKLLRDLENNQIQYDEFAKRQSIYASEVLLFAGAQRAQK